jgi:4-amino-4-deoxy-L-arabinose transferase-like glycosyltransferase
MSKLLLVCCVVLLAVVVRLYNLNQMGRALDEDYIVEKGWKFVDMARHSDVTNPYWYSLPDHPPLANYLYGLVAAGDVIGFDAHATSMDHAYKGVPLFAYDLTNSRLLSVLLSSLTILLVCLLGWEYLSPFVGVAAGIILATNPFYLGLSQNVNLEMPFMLFFTATVYAFLRFLSRLTVRAALVTGILFGCALEVKQPAVLLFPLLLGFYLLKLRFTKLPDKKPRLMHLAYIIGAAFLTYVLLWPMPWFHLPQFLEFTHKMWLTGHGYPERFLGRLQIDHFYYYGVYFLITIPVLLLAAFFFGVSAIRLDKRWIAYAVLLWFVIPFVGQSLFNLRQHQLRYLVEIYAPFSLIAAFGIEQVVKRFVPYCFR